MKKLYFLLLPLALLALLSSCAANPRLKQTETQTYTSTAGYHIELPLDWQLVEEQEESSIFMAPENAISLTVFNELGGEAYYGLDEITAMLMEQLGTGGQSWQNGRVVADSDKERRQVFKGTDAAGSTVYMDITVLQPHPGIRYYLLFAAGASSYNSRYSLLGDIVNSFTLDEDVPFLYSLMEERREDEINQEAEQAVEQESDPDPEQEPELEPEQDQDKD